MKSYMAITTLDANKKDRKVILRNLEEAVRCLGVNLCNGISLGNFF